LRAALSWREIFDCLLYNETSLISLMLRAYDRLKDGDWRIKNGNIIPFIWIPMGTEI
jgi:hypothetical protein